MKTLLPIFGDQLSLTLASLQQADQSSSIILMTECVDEATYVKHHKKKLVFVFSAMRHFAQTLQHHGWTVEYIKLGDADNPGTLCNSIKEAVDTLHCNRVLITETGEWRLQQALSDLGKSLDCNFEQLADTRFICTHASFQAWASSRKQLRMENFYQSMRRQTGLLMEGDKPVGDRWNFDAENRKPATSDILFQPPAQFDVDDITQQCIDLVSRQFTSHIGTVDDFWFAVTTEQAEHALEQFISRSLPQFGSYQDAMLADEPYLAHSILGLYINIGLLDPLDVCRRVEQAYTDGHAPINAVEGFIRQIIGWREYVRGIYWLKMPDYLESNYFDYDGELPDFYWTADTSMNCLRASIQQTIDNAYAHHIQRLMITGNFAMLIGVNPKYVHEWYLQVYADAYEWVELPNTIGMSQFADGGLLGSKPYAAGGNYIKKMSNYCKGCEFNVNKKAGPQACPFNYLYWYFIDKHREKLSGNYRLAQVYRTWDRMAEERKLEVLDDSRRFMETITDNANVKGK